MKRAICVQFVLLFLSVSIANGSSLNSNARYIKDNFPNEYENNLKKHAIDKWEDNFNMAVYEINKQADALFSIINKFESENTKIALKAIEKWTYEGFEKSNKEKIKSIDTFEIKQLINLHCNWSMVEYEYDKQVEAKNSL